MIAKYAPIDKSRPRGEAAPMPAETIRDLADQVAAKEKMSKFGDKKTMLTLRIDPDLIQFFKAGGMGWQTRINAVLRNHVEQQIRG